MKEWPKKKEAQPLDHTPDCNDCLGCRQEGYNQAVDAFMKVIEEQPKHIQGFVPFTDDDFFETLKSYSNGLINDSNGPLISQAIAERANTTLKLRIKLSTQKGK